eukprot:comp22508_c1_seq2/m.56271 comp22508_c1_seq2/g.56271  ORF comp22508_c1_seq2/g.56271 comp22508_c1_seq2/m.56271 type:complete len:429 (+) comp22508_c1_seq2:4688-5974(+)
MAHRSTRRTSKDGPRSIMPCIWARPRLQRCSSRAAQMSTSATMPAKPPCISRPCAAPSNAHACSSMQTRTSMSAMPKDAPRSFSPVHRAKSPSRASCSKRAQTAASRTMLDTLVCTMRCSTATSMSCACSSSTVSAQTFSPTTATRRSILQWPVSARTALLCLSTFPHLCSTAISSACRSGLISAQAQTPATRTDAPRSTLPRVLAQQTSARLSSRPAPLSISRTMPETPRCILRLCTTTMDASVCSSRPRQTPTPRISASAPRSSMRSFARMSQSAPASSPPTQTSTPRMSPAGPRCTWAPTPTPTMWSRFCCAARPTAISRTPTATRPATMRSASVWLISCSHCTTRRPSATLTKASACLRFLRVPRSMCATKLDSPQCTLRRCMARMHTFVSCSTSAPTQLLRTATARTPSMPPPPRAAPHAESR